MLCVRCGGKGYYLLINGFPGIHNKGEIVFCGECEKGFNYTFEIEDHG